MMRCKIAVMRTRSSKFCTSCGNNLCNLPSVEVKSEEIAEYYGSEELPYIYKCNKAVQGLIKGQTFGILLLKIPW